MSLDNGGNVRPDAAIEIGKPIVVDLMDGTSMRGFVHAHDKAATLVCLELIPSAELALISTLNVKSVSTLNDISSTRIWPLNPTIDAQRVRAEQEKVFHKRHSQYLQIGLGVTPSAQAVFDLLAKTLPCKWDQDVIVILDTVRLSAPYDVDSISEGDAGVVNRVKMVLENESKAIKSTVDTNGVTPT